MINSKNYGWFRPSDALPATNDQVEIAAFCRDSNPPFWHLSHAFYHQETHQWVRKGGEFWEIQYWRRSEVLLPEVSLYYREHQDALDAATLALSHLVDLSRLHGNIAADTWPEGWDRMCLKCGNRYHMTTAECGRALSHGWPKYCPDCEKENADEGQ